MPSKMHKGAPHKADRMKGPPMEMRKDMPPKGMGKGPPAPMPPKGDAKRKRK